MRNTFWTFTLPNNVNSSMARSKVTDVGTGDGIMTEAEL
jgi:D-alanine-D-alanine ligase-like ATP-grasp enzyme